MAKKTKKAGITGKYGPRYGRKTRKKIRVVEAQKRASRECPECEKKTIKRVAQGIFECKKCGAKIAGKAYTLK
jgi:large subunit ribosomal protein L37Ae